MQSCSVACITRTPQACADCALFDCAADCVQAFFGDMKDVDRDNEVNR